MKSSFSIHHHHFLHQQYSRNENLIQYRRCWHPKIFKNRCTKRSAVNRKTSSIPSGCYFAEWSFVSFKYLQSLFVALVEITGEFIESVQNCFGCLTLPYIVLTLRNNIIGEIWKWLLLHLNKHYFKKLDAVEYKSIVLNWFDANLVFLPQAIAFKIEI